MTTLKFNQYFEKMNPNAKVWIYQSSRNFNEKEVQEISEALKQFVSNWTAHGASLLADAQLISNRFIVFAVDESQAMASGCSIDKSVAIIRQLQSQYNIDLLNRTNILYQSENAWISEHFNDVKEKLANHTLTSETHFFDNTITKLKDFHAEWLKPMKNSWLS